MNFIAVDIGSTFIKGAIYDLTYNKVVYTYKYPSPQRKELSDPHYFEVDIQQVVDIILDIIRKSSLITFDISGILFSTQQHGFVLHHPQRGDDVYISWQDTRCLKINPLSGISYLEELEQILPPSLMEKTGVPIKPALALCNLYTLFQEEKLSTNGDIQIYTLGSYIIHKLTGNNICHITNAAPLGFVDLQKGIWATDILDKVGLSFLKLPQITSDMTCCGYYKTEDTNLAVYPDLGDVQTSVYGTGAKSGDMIANIGTSGQLIMIRDDYDPGDYEIRPYYDNNYCYVISRMPGGRNFDVLINFFKQIGEQLFGITLERSEIWERIQKQYKNPVDNGLKVDCGFYELPDRLADGGIFHIDHANLTLEHLIAATAKDYGQQYHRFARNLCKGLPFHGTLYFSGGAVLKNPFLKQAIEKEISPSHVVTAQTDEVYSGLFQLAKRCIQNY